MEKYTEVTGFLQIQLSNGEDLEFLNEEGWKVKNEIDEKFSTGEITTFEGKEIHDINYSFVRKEL